LSPDFVVYEWSKSNQYFISSTEQEIAIGGGGASAIWIDANLLTAFSEICPTFDSPSLTKEIRFKILNMEAWKIEHGRM
jgi:hypothetical protein